MRERKRIIDSEMFLKAAIPVMFTNLMYERIDR